MKLTIVDERDDANRAFIDAERAFKSLSSLWLKRSRDQRAYEADERKIYDALLELEPKLSSVILGLKGFYGLGDK